MSRVLITGCAGFLASHLILRLSQAKKHELFGISDVPPSPVLEGMRVFQEDIRNRQRMMELIAEVRPELTFHLAAVTNVGFAWKNQPLTYEVNFIGSSNLLEAVSRHAPASRLLLMSSAEIYRPASGLIDETAPIFSSNPYALSKVAMELLADLYVEALALDVVKVRPFNFTGPGQDQKFVASDFARQIAAIEKNLQEPVIRVGNLSAVRDFSDVRDIVRYLEVLSWRGEKGRVYNLCSGRRFSIQQVLDRLLSFSKRAIRVEADPDRLRPSDHPLLAGDCSRLEKEFGLKPEIPFEQTLLDLLNDWRRRL